MSKTCPLSKNPLPYQFPPKNTVLKTATSIVLVGMMGAGKSTIGQKLAKKLNYQWIDCDDYIEEQESRSISNIFEKNGEKAFRAIESEAIKKLLAENSNIVISLGGGAFSNTQTRNRCKKMAITIWLKASIQTIIERVSKGANRPLLRQNNGENLESNIGRLLAEREKFYEQAHIVIDENKIENIIKDIISKLHNIKIGQ